MATADDFKAKGNAALQEKNFSEAIEHYTSAINLNGSNHVYYSNRSAAYLSKGDGQNALEDANSCISLNPKFAKGYGRKGAALHSLKRYNDSIASYEEGLGEFPGDKGLVSGMDSVKKEKDGPAFPSAGGLGGLGGMGGGMGGLGGMPGMGSLFGPDMMAKIAMNPKLRKYLNDEDFMTKIKTLQEDPNKLGTMLGDPKIMELFQAMLGMGGAGGMPGDDNEDMDVQTVPDEASAASESTPTPPAAASTQDSPQPMEVEEVVESDDDDDIVELDPEEEKRLAAQKKSVKAKERGNALYKAKKFDEAIAAYDEAIACDSTNMTFLSNKAAVYFTSKRWDECIETCKAAVEVGKENRAPFEDRAKAMFRCAKAYQKKKDLGNAIEMCKSAQLEHFDKTTQRLMKNMELEKRKADTLAYQDDDKAEEAKQLGNNHFRAKEWGDAVKAYEESVKRAPKNATTRNNLAAALCKVMDFNGAKRAIEVALDIDPKYVKAWARKADIEVLMKENHKAMESYKKGLALDPSNKSCRDGLQKVASMVNQGSANMTEDERKERAAHAMADPDIQNILTDPIINQILKDFNENPTAAQQAMTDPGIRGKIEKLIAAGVLQTA